MPSMRYQPQGRALLNQASPLVRGLVFASVAGGADLISGVSPVRMGAGSKGFFEQGKTLYTPGVTSDGWYWPLPSTHPLYGITTQDTIFILARRIAGSSFNNLLGVPYKAGSWASPYYAWNLSGQSDNTMGAYCFAVNSTTRNSVNGPAGLFADNVTRPYGATRNGTRVRFYTGNAQYSQDYAIASGSPDWSNKQPLVLFNRSNTSAGEGMQAHAGLVLVWNRELSAEEWASLAANPWQIFVDQSDEDELVVVVSAKNYSDSSGSTNGVGSASAIARAIATAYGTSTATSATSPASLAVCTTSGSSSGTSSATSGANTIWKIVGASQGTSSATALAFAVTQVSATSAGFGASSAQALMVNVTSGTSSGVAAVSGNAACVWQVSGNSAASSSVVASAAFQDSSSQVVFFDVGGTSYGSSSLSAQAQAVATSAGNSAGASTVLPAAQVLISAIGSALASAAVAGVGATIISTTGAAVAASLAQSSANTLLEAAGVSSGTSSAQSVTITIYNSVASSLSVSEVVAIAQSVVGTMPTSRGTSSVSGITEGGVHYTASGDTFNINITLSAYNIQLEPKRYVLQKN